MVISGVVVRELTRHTDSRGWLAEIFRADEPDGEFDEDLVPLMAYVSSTMPGTARGPHEHREQTDIFCFVGVSEFTVYLWDNRKGSDTFGKKEVFKAPFGKTFYIKVPPGVVHAYKNTGTVEGLVFNAPNRLFRGPARTQEVDEIRYEERPEAGFVLD
jgi:dTDP-4-dehydrorhamnose 3,5-epimerase